MRACGAWEACSQKENRGSELEDGSCSTTRAFWGGSSYKEEISAAPHPNSSTPTLESLWVRHSQIWGGRAVIWVFTQKQFQHQLCLRLLHEHISSGWKHSWWLPRSNVTDAQMLGHTIRRKWKRTKQWIWTKHCLLQCHSWQNTTHSSFLLNQRPPKSHKCCTNNPISCFYPSSASVTLFFYSKTFKGVCHSFHHKNWR